MTQYETEGTAVAVPRKEACRYLGYRGITPDAAVGECLERCVEQLQKECHPRAVWERYPLRVEKTAGESVLPEATDSVSGGKTVKDAEKSTCRIVAGDLRFISNDLGRNLDGCTTLVLMAATIGTGVDYLIRRAEARSMVEAAVYQAAGAAMVEAWCDTVNQRIVETLRREGLFARPRFSPGYGDAPLTLQRDFSRLLAMPATCGISLTDTLLMVPSKSVTAFIGFSKQNKECVIAGCEACGKREDCAYHRLKGTEQYET